LRAADAAFYGFRLSGAYWADIGTPDEYIRATADALAGRVHLRGTRARGIAGDAHLGDDVHVEGDVRIGAGARLGARVRVIGPSVLGDGVTVGEDARIERAIVWDNAAIGDRAALTDTVVGIDYTIAADAVLHDTIVANEPVTS
jgi:NDP-sugar pyrophosphorylase family protein